MYIGTAGLGCDTDWRSCCAGCVWSSICNAAGSVCMNIGVLSKGLSGLPPFIWLSFGRWLGPLSFDSEPTHDSQAQLMSACVTSITAKSGHVTVYCCLVCARNLGPRVRKKGSFSWSTFPEVTCPPVLVLGTRLPDSALRDYYCVPGTSV